MMNYKSILTFCLFLLCVSVTYAQVDTLFINGEKIPCSVKEVTADAVKFAYPGEDLVNTVYKNTVQQIKFKSGRTQTFIEASSYKKVSSVDDYDNVTMTSVESEVKGLYKLGEVSSKAKGTTTLSNQERVKERAYRKLKIEAAMLGANIVYLTNQRSEGNKFGGYYQSGSSAETNLTGVAYTNQLPSIEDFKKLTNGKSDFVVVEETKMWSSDSDMSKSAIKKDFKILDIVNDNGIITINGELSGVKKYSKFRLVGFTADSFNIYYKDKSTVYNYKVQFK